MSADKLTTKTNRLELVERITESDKPTRIVLWCALILEVIIAVAFRQHRIFGRDWLGVDSVRLLKDSRMWDYNFTRRKR